MSPLKIKEKQSFDSCSINHKTGLHFFFYFAHILTKLLNQEKVVLI